MSEIQIPPDIQDDMEQAARDCTASGYLARLAMAQPALRWFLDELLRIHHHHCIRQQCLDGLLCAEALEMRNIGTK